MHLLVIGGVASAPLARKLWDRLPKKAEKIVLPVLLLAGLVLCTAYLVDSTYNPFIYFNF